MTKQDPVEGRQRETNLEITTKQDPVEGRQRETKEDRPGNHVVTKSVSLQELRTPSAEAVWGKINNKWTATQVFILYKGRNYFRPLRWKEVAVWCYAPSYLPFYYLPSANRPLDLLPNLPGWAIHFKVATPRLAYPKKMAAWMAADAAAEKSSESSESVASSACSAGPP